MRPPRYHFPDEVRDTTRDMAHRMVSGGAVVRTPAELDAWVAQAPDARASLVRGGYGTHFTADDLFPLLEVFVAKAGGTVPRAGVTAYRTRNPWVVGLLVLLVVSVLAVVVATMVRP